MINLNNNINIKNKQENEFLEPEQEIYLHTVSEEEEEMAENLLKTLL